MSVNAILKAAREMREAARYWESESHTDAEHASWPQNQARAQPFLAALKAWDDLIDSLPKFDTGDPYIVGVHGPAPTPLSVPGCMHMPRCDDRYECVERD